MLAADIEPWICLYHWDLPQALEDRGGWQKSRQRPLVRRLRAVVARRLGDRVRHLATFNEPESPRSRAIATASMRPESAAGRRR